MHASMHAGTHKHNHVYRAKSKECMVLTGTHYSCILRVGTGTSKVVGALATFCQVTLCPCTVQSVIPGWTISSSKGSRPGSFNCSWIAQLTAHNYSVKKVPVVITHSAPMAKEKDLNTTFQRSIPSHQSNSTFFCCVI